MDSSIKSMSELPDSNDPQGASVATTTTPVKEEEIVEQTSGPKVNYNSDQTKEIPSSNTAEEEKKSTNSECNNDLEFNSSSGPKTELSNSVDDSLSDDKTSITNSGDCSSKPQGEESKHSILPSHQDQTEQETKMTGQESKREENAMSKDDSTAADNSSIKTPEESQGNISDKVSESQNSLEENKDDVLIAENEQDEITDSEESISQLRSTSSPDEDLSLISDSCDTFSLDPKLASSSALEALTPESQDEQLVVSLPAVNDISGERPADTTDTGSASKASAPSAAVCPPSGPKKELELKAGSSFETDEASSPPSVYSVKWVMFNNNKVPLITQNENGPCPLIAIMNVLLLLKKIQFPALMEMVTSDQLMSYLGECIFENASKNITEDSRLNYEQNMQDAMAIFHKLQTGLDVNVRFTGVCDFEYTPECVIFDLLEIRLYHGWLVDPQEPQAVSAVGNCSYNQLVEKIIAQKSSEKEELVTEALLAETFLESSAAQLTYHGLCELSTTVKEGELCVCFRNNHFSTLYRHKGELFILVTDQGFLTESNVVWETLSNVEGDSHYVDANFHTYTKPELPPLLPTDLQLPPGSDQQIDQDYLVALSLQQEQQLQVDQAGAGWNQPPQQQAQQPSQPQPSVPTVPLSDHELAVRLQEEEDRRAAAAFQQQQQSAPQQTAGGQEPRSPGSQSSSSSSGGRRGQRERERKEKDSCTIL